MFHNDNDSQSGSSTLPQLLQDMCITPMEIKVNSDVQKQMNDEFTASLASVFERISHTDPKKLENVKLITAKPIATVIFSTQVEFTLR